MIELSEAEQTAMDWLRNEGGEILTSRIEDKSCRDVFGGTIPGMTVFKKLAKKGLVFFSEEEPFELEDGTWFQFTNSVCLGKTE